MRQQQRKINLKKIKITVYKIIVYEKRERRRRTSAGEAPKTHIDTHTHKYVQKMFDWYDFTAIASTVRFDLQYKIFRARPVC